MSNNNKNIEFYPEINVQHISEEEENIFESPDLLFKIIIIGNPGVGKSCLSLYGISKKFVDNYKPTLGFEFYKYNAIVNKKKIRLQIYDTCGQETYNSLIQNFYKNTGLAIIVYSIDNEKSFKNVDNWIKQLKTYASPDIQIFLIGNKNDLPNREVTYEEGEKFKNEYNLKIFMESSAKTGFNVDKIFENAIKILYVKHEKLKKFSGLCKNITNENDDIFLRNSIKISAKEFIKKDKNKRKCCI
jgi:small GTP-binding protein